MALADKDHMYVADFFGTATGHTMKDKFERTVYTAEKSAFVNALVFDQFQLGYYTIGEKVGQAWDAGKEWMKK